MDSVFLICAFGFIVTGIIIGYPIGALVERRAQRIAQAKYAELNAAEIEPKPVCQNTVIENYGILAAELLEEESNV